MDKILELLESAGCKPELVSAIGEALSQYKATIQERFQADYQAKVETAKRICVEETEAHKRELARRAQIWFETRGAAIDNRIQHHLAIGESEALAKLRNVRAVVEGVEVNNGQANGVTPAVIENANKQIKQLTEERDRAITTANKQTAIAEKVLARNRELVTENTNLRTRKPISESHQQPRQTRRLDQGRKGGTPVTTRPALVESHTRQPAPQPTQANVRSTGGFGVGDIADRMDEDLV